MAFFIVFGFFALTAVAFVWRWALRDSTEPAPLTDKLVFTALFGFQILIAVPVLGPFGPFLVVGCTVMLSLLWVPTLADIVFAPFGGIFTGGGEAPEARPQLSTVHAKRMQGRYDEALADLRAQLEQFPQDFEAQMLLAELLVEHKKEFANGVAALETLLAQPHPPPQITAALNALADWQLKHRADPDAARAALERIIAQFPGTVFASRAQQRAEHLPSREELAARHQPKKLTLVHVEDYIKPGGQRGHVGVAAEKSPEQLAEELCERLRQHPHDTEAREQLALIYADDFGQLDWAADQLEQLIRQPHRPERDAIHWLELLAGLQRRHGDLPAACRAYQRIIDQFPRNPAAERARGQLAAIGVAPAGQTKSQA